METGDRRFKDQLSFIKELDQLKTIKRRTYLLDETRTENDAEHSWQIAAMALLLAEYSDSPGMDMLKVVKILLFHDVIEIDAGDTYMYDEAAKITQAAREKQAAERVFGLLPADQREEVHSLWVEFEEGRTPEARFARAIDRFQPFFHNYLTKGKAWREHDVGAKAIRPVIDAIRSGSQKLWEFSQSLLAHALVKGYCKP